MYTMFFRLSVLSLLSFAVSAQDGAALYKQRCAGCHDAGANRAPNAAALKQMSPEAVNSALVNGSMMLVGMGLTSAEIRTLATHVTGKQFGGGGIPQRAYCSAPAPLPANPLSGPHWNGWGVNAENHRFQPAAMARLSAADTPKLKLKWAFGLPNTARATAQPAVAGGRVFVGSTARQVFSLDASSGCIHWIFEPDFGVRTAITLGPAGRNWSVYFGDSGTNIYAVDANTGKLSWKTRVDQYPGAFVTGAPKLHEGRLYVGVSSGEEVFGAAPDYECCKFRGSVVALDSATGKQIWKSHTIQEEPKPVRKNSAGTQMWGPSGAGVWSSPTIDVKRRAVYVSTGDSYSDPAARTSDAFLAFDLETGKLLWSRQFTAGDAFNIACGGPTPANCPQANGPDHDFASSPILVTLANGKRALVAGQKSGVVHAVDPDQQGELLWQTKVAQGGMMGGVQWGSAVDDRNIYVAVSDIEVRPAKEPGPDTQQGIMGMVAVNPKKGGGLYALRLADGKRVWETPHPGCTKPGCSPAQSAAVTMIPGVIFSAGIDGHLRAYAAADGKIIWDVDTIRDYETVNGVRGSGGSIDGPGPVVVNGMVYVNSGYALFSGVPGNVLLAYSVDGK